MTTEEENVQDTQDVVTQEEELQLQDIVDDSEVLSFDEKYWGQRQSETIPTPSKKTEEKFEQMIQMVGESQVLSDYAYFKAKGYKDNDIIAALNESYNGGAPAKVETPAEGGISDMTAKEIAALKKEIDNMKQYQNDIMINQKNSMAMYQVMADAGVEPTEQNLERLGAAFYDLYGKEAARKEYTEKQLARIIKSEFPDVANAKIKVPKAGNNPAKNLNRQANAPEVLKTVPSQQPSKPKKVDMSQMTEMERHEYQQKQIDSLLGL